VVDKVAQTKAMKLCIGAFALVFIGSFALRSWKHLDANTSGLSLRLVNAEGEALDCAATLWVEGKGIRQANQTSSQTCQDGWLAWTELSPGPYRVISQAEDMVLFEQVVDIDQDFVELGEITLVEGRNIRGLVLLGGQPIGGALILVEGGRRTHSDEEGRFSFRGLPKTTLALRAAAQASRGALDVPADAQEDLVLHLERGRGQGLLGLKFKRKALGPVVVDLLDGTAAAEQLERGDRILYVDGVAVGQLTSEEIAQLLAGELSSYATLLIERAGEQQSVTLLRIDPVALTQE
jgi:hypothetical protein